MKMTPSDHSLEVKTAIATLSTYVTSGTLVAGTYMDYLNAHAGAFGVILGAATFLVNVVFQLLNRKLIIKSQNEGEQR